MNLYFSPQRHSVHRELRQNKGLPCQAALTGWVNGYDYITPCFSSVFSVSLWFK